MFSRLLRPHDHEGSVGVVHEDTNHQHSHLADPCLVLTSDPKPRLRWTTDLHQRFVDAVTQLGGPSTLGAMQEEFAQVKSSNQTKLDEANALVDGIEEKSSTVNKKLYDAEARLAEVNRENTELDMKLREMEVCEKATPKAIMRTMNVKGLTLYHLKSHLQKYRLGKQAGKDSDEGCKDGISGSYLLESPGTEDSSPKLLASDANEGHEVKEALRAQMEVQSKLHLLVEAEKHLLIRQDAERRYMAMLERACKMLADQFIGESTLDTDIQKYQELPSNELGGMHVSDIPYILQPQGANCSTESCLTSLESLRGLTLEGSPGGTKRMVGLDSMVSPLIWSETNMRSQGIHLAQVNPQGIARYGM